MVLAFGDLGDKPLDPREVREVGRQGDALAALGLGEASSGRVAHVGLSGADVDLGLAMRQPSAVGKGDQRPRIKAAIAIKPAPAVICRENAEANRIFGYDAWDRRTLASRCVWSGQLGGYYGASGSWSCCWCATHPRTRPT